MAKAEASAPVSLRGTRAIRAARAPKPEVDPWRPLAVLEEEERTVSGQPARSLTVFLAGAECPFTCVFCDLWKNTLDRPTPEGALVRQIEMAIEDIGASRESTRLKLYNASNFFDPRAVPTQDLGRIAELCAGFDRVVVECHPRLIDERCLAFADSLDGRLELALGLETVHPRALPRLNKEMDLADWDRACKLLRDAGLKIRAFVLQGAPFVPAESLVDWTVISAAYALASGVETVTLIPVRRGAELDLLAAEGDWHEPDLTDIEAGFERALGLAGGVVLLDTWDLEALRDRSGCSSCTTEQLDQRLERLRRMNTTGALEPRVGCSACVGKPA